MARNAARRQTPDVPREPTATHESHKVELDVLYRNQQRALVRFFVRGRASHDDARDLVQDAFLRLSRLDLRRVGAIARPEAYLRQIARNLLRDRAKNAHSHAELCHVNADDVPLTSIDQERLLEARDSVARLEAAIKTLKPATREIFMAHRLDGMSYAEIAAHTGMSAKGVEKKVARALVELARLMGRS